jgi:hypothetical protein
MKLSELKAIIDRSVEHMREGEDKEVMIAVKLPYTTVGSIPMVPVKYAFNGFDWEKGKFVLTPEENLTPADRDFAKQMREMQERAGNADYENRRLKAEIKRLNKLLEKKSEV